MANPHLKNLINLDTAVSICQKQDKICLWHTNGIAIKYDDKIPEGYFVARTSVLVNHNGSCLVMFICISQSEPKALIMAAGDFSSLEELKAHSPDLFNVVGELNIV